MMGGKNLGLGFMTLALLLGTGNLWGESENSLEVGIYTGVLRGESEPELAITGDLVWTWRSRGIENARTDLILAATVGDTILPEVRKAQVRLYFEDLQLSLGKTRAGWGVGQFFNAGDLLFPGAVADPSAEELRDTNRWMALANYPLGLLSFVELVATAPPYNLGEQFQAAISGAPAPEAPPWYDGGGGARVFLDFGPAQVQSGYLMDGSIDQQSIYLSLQGAVIWDVYFAASYNLPLDQRPDQAYSQGFLASMGTFSSLELDGLGTLDWRLEAQSRPLVDWQKSIDRLDPSHSALELAGQLGFSPSRLFSLNLRGILDISDGSGQGIFALRWNYDRGIQIFLLSRVNIGSREDRYNWYDSQGWQAVLGVSSRF